MYSYLALGENGQLGNQMFQYAALYSISKFNNSKGLIPDIELQLYNAFPKLSLEKKSAEEILTMAKWKYEPNERLDFTFDKNFFCIKDDAIISGFYQSPLYFEMVKDDILKEFTFNENVVSYCRDQYTKLKQSSSNSQLCAVHFRRTDYLAKPDFHHNLEWGEYYSPVLGQMMQENPDVKFVVFSDDYEWCKSSLPEGFLFHDSIDQYHDLCLMSMCDLHVIANSSFSWWGAYLANNDNPKSVIAPGRWFGNAGPHAWETIWDPKWRVAGLNNPMSQLTQMQKSDIENMIYSCKIGGE